MKHLLLLLPLLFLFSGCATQNQVCEKKFEDIPPIRGLRLGMTCEEVQRVIPSFKAGNKNRFGASLAVFQYWPFDPNEMALSSPLEADQIEARWIGVEDAEEFASIKRLQLGFVDDRLATISIYYLNDLRWESAQEFAEHVAREFQLVGEFTQTGDGFSCTCTHAESGAREMMTIEASLKKLNCNGAALPYLHLEDVLAARKPLARRTQEEKKLNEERDAQKRAFKL